MEDVCCFDIQKKDGVWSCLTSNIGWWVSGVEQTHQGTGNCNYPVGFLKHFGTNQRLPKPYSHTGHRSPNMSFFLVAVPNERICGVPSLGRTHMSSIKCRNCGNIWTPKASRWNLAWIAIQVQVRIQRVEMHIGSYAAVAQHHDTLDQTSRRLHASNFLGWFDCIKPFATIHECVPKLQNQRHHPIFAVIFQPDHHVRSTITCLPHLPSLHSLLHGPSSTWHSSSRSESSCPSASPSVFADPTESWRRRCDDEKKWDQNVSQSINYLLPGMDNAW